MSLSHPDRRRDLPVRLCDLSEDALELAAEIACRQETDPLKQDEIRAAAKARCDQVFFVERSAEPLLRRIAA